MVPGDHPRDLNAGLVEPPTVAIYSHDQELVCDLSKQLAARVSEAAPALVRWAAY